jgi:hypothetical protein
MTKKKPTLEQIRASAELAKIHGEPIRDALLSGSRASEQEAK